MSFDNLPRVEREYRLRELLASTEAQVASLIAERDRTKEKLTHTRDELKALIYRASEAMGHGVDDTRWPCGTHVVNALIAERDATKDALVEQTRRVVRLVDHGESLKAEVERLKAERADLLEESGQAHAEKDGEVERLKAALVQVSSADLDAHARADRAEAAAVQMREAMTTSMARCPIGCHAESFCGQCAPLVDALSTDADSNSLDGWLSPETVAKVRELLLKAWDEHGCLEKEPCTLGDRVDEIESLLDGKGGGA